MATGNNAFNLQGATQYGLGTTLPKQSGVLSGMSLPNNNSTQNTGLLQGNKPVTYQAPQPGTNQGLINPKPTTPVKKVSSTNPNGSVMTVEYHPEAKTGSSSTTSTSPTTTPTPEQLQTNTNQNNQANYGTMNAPVGNTTGTQVQNVANTGQQTSQENQMQQRVLQAGQKSPDQMAALKAVEYGLGVQNNNNFGQYAEAGLHGNDPQAYVDSANAPDLVGRAAGDRALAGQYSNLYGTQANAALSEANTIANQNLTASQNAYSGAQTQAGRAAGEANTVLGAVAPMGNTPYALNPAAGTYTGSGTSAGTSASDAVQNAGMLSGLQSGAAALSASPGQTNAAIGSKYAQQGADLSTSLTQFNNVATAASNFLTSNLGINPTDIPKINEQIGTYMQNIKNPAAMAQYNLMMNDTTALQGSILNSYGGSTPTANVNATLQTDPRTLPVNQLQSWFSTLKQLGDIQLGAQQGTSSAAYSSTKPYSGTPTTANTSTTTTPGATTTGLTPENLGEAAGGTALNIAGSALKSIENVGGEILGFIGSHILSGL